VKAASLRGNVLRYVCVIGDTGYVPCPMWLPLETVQCPFASSVICPTKKPFWYTKRPLTEKQRSIFLAYGPSSPQTFLVWYCFSNAYLVHVATLAQSFWCPHFLGAKWAFKRCQKILHWGDWREVTMWYVNIFLFPFLLFGHCHLSLLGQQPNICLFSALNKRAEHGIFFSFYWACKRLTLVLPFKYFVDAKNTLAFSWCSAVTCEPLCLALLTIPNKRSYTKNTKSSLIKKNQLLVCIYVFWKKTAESCLTCSDVQMVPCCELAINGAKWALSWVTHQSFRSPEFCSVTFLKIQLLSSENQCLNYHKIDYFVLQSFFCGLAITAVMLQMHSFSWSGGDI
jgi:hypothetical protein